MTNGSIITGRHVPGIIPRPAKGVHQGHLLRRRAADGHHYFANLQSPSPQLCQPGRLVGQPLAGIKLRLLSVRRLGQGRFEMDQIKGCQVLAVEKIDDIGGGIADQDVEFLHVYLFSRLLSKFLHSTAENSRLPEISSDCLRFRESIQELFLQALAGI